MEPHQILQITDPSQVTEARRIVVALAARLGFDAADVGRVGVVVAEVGTNILKHAGRGQLLVRPLREDRDRPGIELLALDRGPGMADLERCRRDGYSTAGSPGTGLGAISRLSSLLEIHSAPGAGTAILLRLLPRGEDARGDGGSILVGAVRAAAPGEVECGDDWSFAGGERRAVLMVVDGLGHGVEAAKAAREAVRAFGSHASKPAAEILTATHQALLHTRGAAVSVAELDLERGQVHYAGIGNVAGALVSAGGLRSMLGQNGTVGGVVPRARSVSYPWVPGAAVLMHSDGLTSQVSLQRYPGLLHRHPSLVAGVLFRDFGRGRDDATVVVARWAGGEP